VCDWLLILKWLVRHTRTVGSTFKFNHERCIFAQCTKHTTAAGDTNTHTSFFSSCLLIWLHVVTNNHNMYLHLSLCTSVSSAVIYNFRQIQVAETCDLFRMPDKLLLILFLSSKVAVSWLFAFLIDTECDSNLSLKACVQGPKHILCRYMILLCMHTL